MTITELFQGQLEREAKTTRTALSRVPEGRNDWKPHEKSMNLGYLATLVATIPGWIALIVNQDELDLSGFTPQQVTGNRTLVDALETSVAKAREALSKTNDEHLMTTWKLRMGERVLSEQVRHVAIRDSVFHHLAHHRGQLTVYLRLNDIPVPAIYGPSADERI